MRDITKRQIEEIFTSMKFRIGIIFVHPVFQRSRKTDNLPNRTRMTTFIKTKFNKSDGQTNIDNIE